MQLLMSGQEEIGQIQINDEVLATIAQYAAQEVDGVAGIAGGSSLSEFLGAKSARRGITVATDEQTSQATLDVEINVEFGLNIYDVALNVQRSVKNAIEGMTGLRVKSVNVKISGIMQSDKSRKTGPVAISPIAASIGPPPPPLPAPAPPPLPAPAAAHPKSGHAG